MKTVRIDKDRLLEIIEHNRDDHEADYVEAAEGYRITVIATLQALLDKAIAGEDVDIGSLLRLQKPREHIEDYDRVLEMLELSVDDVIELDEDDFQHLVQDAWEWKHGFAASTALYKSR